MPSYLSRQTLRDAVERLSLSNATSTVADFLIFKRAYKLSKDEAAQNSQPMPDSVISGKRSVHFVRAIEEVTLRVPYQPERSDSLTNPYFVPFGSNREKSKGYRGPKYTSNGPANTVDGWQLRSNTPLTLVPDTKPRAYKFVERSERDLALFFKTQSDRSTGEKPRLLDTAIWWFRFTELEQRFGSQPTADNLVAGFISDCDLTEVEVTALFNRDLGDNQLTTPPVEGE